MISLIDFHCGNTASVVNMLMKLGVNVKVVSNARDLEGSSGFILPGVGSFDMGMRNLHGQDLIPLLSEKVLVEKIPILGICLGAQLLFEKSEEGREQGLGWLGGEVKKFDINRLRQRDRIPNMGWLEIKKTKRSLLFDSFEQAPRFYFVHSYHIECRESSDVVATACHGYKFTAAVQRANIFGVQFHPEKSHSFGYSLLKNYTSFCEKLIAQS